MGLVPERSRLMNNGSLQRMGRLDTPALRVLDRHKVPTNSEIHHEDRPASARVDDNLLQAFVARSQPWSRQRIAPPRRLQRMLWLLIPVELLWAIWLATIVSQAIACRGLVCTVSTLDHHAAALLACGIFVSHCSSHWSQQHGASRNATA
jgi:hypothetical protein